MLYISTRGQAAPVTLSEAIRNGAAPDGGLYMPQAQPVLPTVDPSLPLPDYAVQLLAPFFEGDPLAAKLEQIAHEAFDFPVAITSPDAGEPALRALELFHGPTGAFKDFGARFLLRCLDGLGDPDAPLHILVATSGDTGGAVGAAAEGRANVRATILYPRGRVSAFQEHQLTCWEAPVRALEVEGDFDDCQRLVKTAFNDAELKARHRLTSANSINFGRLLPQLAYMAWAAARLEAETGKKPGFIIPTGNLGHGFAVTYARLLGLPVGPVVLATNANPTLHDWQESGTYEPRPSIATIANAMDVGAPSNFERLAHLPEGAADVHVELVDDETIRARIQSDYQRSGVVWCPHTATAAEAFNRLGDARRDIPWLVASTAHPYKFADVIEPLIGRTIAPPPALEAVLERPAHKTCVAATIEALAGELEARETA